MAEKFIKQVAGTLTEQEALIASAGVGDAGKVIALDAAGKISSTMMPTGVAADTKIVTTSEALVAGDLVNIWNSTGAKVRKADASVAGKEAHGFVLAAFGSGVAATVYFEGSDDQQTGMTPGVVYLSASAPGRTQAAAPSVAGQVVQRVGFAVSATEMNFDASAPIVLA